MSIEDRAQEHEAHMWEVNNRPRERKMFKPGERGYGPAECLECEETMPDVRRADGRELCTACQNAADRRKKLLGSAR